jgi:hypothetical protein
LKKRYPTAYVVRLRDLMSDSLQKINQLLTGSIWKKVTSAFSGFAVEHDFP